MEQKSKKTPLIKTFAFLISIINFTGTVISLLTTDMNLLSRRLTAIGGLIADYQYIIPVYFVLSLLLVLITFSELKSKRIPHIITIPGIFLGMIIVRLLNFTPLEQSVGGVISALLFFGGVYLLSKGHLLGFGVVMMEGMLGAFLGITPLLIINGLSSIIVLCYFLIAQYQHPEKRLTTIEFGPILALATGLYLLYPIFMIVIKAA